MPAFRYLPNLVTVEEALAVDRDVDRALDLYLARAHTLVCAHDRAYDRDLGRAHERAVELARELARGHFVESVRELADLLRQVVHRVLGQSPPGGAEAGKRPRSSPRPAD